MFVVHVAIARFVGSQFKYKFNVEPVETHGSEQAGCFGGCIAGTWWGDVVWVHVQRDHLGPLDG